MKKHANGLTAKDIIETVGFEWCRETFGVKDRVVRHHGSTGVLPASWYAALSDRVGEPLPRALFTFKGLDER